MEPVMERARERPDGTALAEIRLVRGGRARDLLVRITNQAPADGPG